ncbi:thiamine-binding protein [Dactylosporangium roseum]|uniref:Thiamine-binding protein n=1 Tax=Dactylosporangium roseum TaxID=47989 RepID=A0ABY5YXT5_9ACTN|nr:thiamine-binding protein [Dactylosporangium roseum]UWZ34570.1 thiamine-binding protein [Dactylosporangium roseum]
MRVRAEFTSEPFTIGATPAHATAALGIVEQSGLRHEFGPFGTSVWGDSTELIPLLSAVVETVLAQGGTRLTLLVESDE